MSACRVALIAPKRSVCETHGFPLLAQPACAVPVNDRDCGRWGKHQNIKLSLQTSATLGQSAVLLPSPVLCVLHAPVIVPISCVLCPDEITEKTSPQH